ncbi:hypothetical protein [Maribellus sediminis]|uniref:hypothetical protein n=1 Tax=Maribellus sediminis TaxID=2696285 RepID=UPI00143075E0|nr:hypothetical protein [Maribellus sediminis]
MDKRLARIEVFVIITMIFSLLSIFLHLASFSGSNENIEKEKISKEMPPDINTDSLNKIINEIKIDWNSSDWNKLHDIFGEYAKAQIRIKDIEQEFPKLKSATGNIMSTAYSHYEYRGFEEDADWFSFYFKCMFDNGKGTIKLSTRTVNEKTELTGININLDEI